MSDLRNSAVCVTIVAKENAGRQGDLQDRVYFPKSSKHESINKQNKCSYYNPNPSPKPSPNLNSKRKRNMVLNVEISRKGLFCPFSQLPFYDQLTRGGRNKTP
jgi:hypothetical protein